MTDDEREIISMIDSGILKIDSMGLIWKCQSKHKEYDGYRVHHPRLIGHNNHGYIRIGIYNKDGKTVHAFAHRIVFMFYNGDIPEGIQVNHKNGIKHDNRLSNLELMTQSQNIRHAFHVLKRKMGNHTNIPRHWKIPREAIEVIKNSTESVKDLAEKYSVTTTRINQIRGGK